MKRFALLAAFAALPMVVAVPLEAAKKADKPAGACKRHYGKGYDFTLDGAKFQAWEITAQVTGNWPIKTDTFKNESYKCKPDGSGYTCISTIDVCKS